MQDSRKTKAQLIEENAALRRRVAELESQCLPETDRRAASTESFIDALRHSDKRVQMLVTILPEAITICDLSGQIKYANEQTARLHGYEQTETLLGLNVFDLIAPAQRQLVADRVRECLAQDVISRFETKLVRSSGQLFSAALSVIALHDEEGVPQAVVGVTHDLTARKQIEDALRASEAQLRAVVEDQTELICRYRPDGILTFVNEAYCRTFGKRREELLGHSFMPLIPEEDRALIAERAATLTPQNPTVTYEHRVIVPNDEIRWQQWTNRAVYDVDDELIEFQLVGRDITERKRIEAALRHSEERYRTLIENQGEGLGLVDPQENFVFANPSAEQLFGVPAGGLIGRNLSEFVDADQYRKIEIQTMLRQLGQQSSYELDLRRPDGRMCSLIVTAVPQFNDQGKFTGTFGVFRDITKRKQAEEEIRRLNSELEQRVAERTKDLQTLNEELQEDIRQRQRIEEMLRRSEQRYRTLFDSAADAIFILALSGQIEEVNRSACDCLGYARDDLLRMQIADVTAPEQRPHVQDRMKNTRHQVSNFYETIYQRRDNSLIHVEVNSRVIEYAGRPAILSIVRDITGRRHIEETLRRSEASLAEAQRIAHFGSWTWDLATDRLQCSDEMFRLVGLLPQEVEVTPEVFLKFLHPEEVEWILEKIQHVGSDESPTGLEHRLVRSNGEIRQVYSRVKVYRDENGNPLRLLGSTQDITDNKQVEQALRQYADEQAVLLDSAFQLTNQLSAQEVLRSILKNALQLMTARTAAVALYEPERDVLVVAMLYDRERGLVQEMRGMERLPGDGAIGQAFQQGRTLVINDYPMWEERGPVSRILGQTVRALVAVPLLGRHAILGVLLITGDERKVHFDEHDAKLIELFAVQAAIALENAQLYERQQEQYRRLQDAQARLIQSEKMSALGRLIASISHEINNPLQAVQGCLTLIHEGLEEELPRLSGVDATTWLQDLDVASTELQRITAMVQRLRDFYRPARPGFQATALPATIESVLALAAKQLQRSGIAVEQPSRTEPPIVITTNADQLRQVILNLVLNAIDAMPDGGRLRVVVLPDTLSMDDQRRPAVRIDFTDTGPGISPDNLTRVFEPFFTTKDTGSGLGLSISYELVKALGGDLSVASEMGAGATFTIRLPLEPTYETVSTP
jgi:PAS domain S-box-containing protein